MRTLLHRGLILFATLMALVLAPGAAAQESGTIRIGSAEIVTEVGPSEFVTVTGTGVCGSQGLVDLAVFIFDGDTGGTGVGEAVANCTRPGEHLKWSVGTVSGNVRAGDRVSVSVTATGAINDEDFKTTMLKQYH